MHATKRLEAREPISITPLDISHSSAVPVAAGAVSRCLGMQAGGCRTSLPPLPLQRMQRVGGELVRGLLSATKLPPPARRAAIFHS